jgi:hypothetical protein
MDEQLSDEACSTTKISRCGIADSRAVYSRENNFQAVVFAAIDVDGITGEDQQAGDDLNCMANAD